MAYIWVFLGSALGGMARYWCSGVTARAIGSTFPWGTLVVNVVGSMLIGLFATLALSGGIFGQLPDAGLFAMVGFCGGYTTISSFSLQTLNLALEGEWIQVGANVIGSVALGLAACLAGHWIAVTAVV